MTLRELAVKVFFEADEKPVLDFERKVSSLFKTLSFAGVSVGAAGAALFKLTDSVAKSAEELEKQSLRLGINAQTLQEFEFAAKKAGDVTREELGGALGFLSRQLGNAALGAKASQEALAAAGVKITKSGKLPGVADAFEQVIKQLNGITNESVRATIAQDVFGRQFAQRLLPVIAKGSDVFTKLRESARKNGGFLSEDDIQRATKFDESLGSITTTIKGLVTRVGIALLPAAQKLSQAFESFLNDNQLELIETISEVFKSLATIIKIVGTTLLAVVKTAVSFARVLGGIDKVAKALALTFSIFMGAKTLIAIGAVVQALWTMVTAIRAVQFAAIAAQASALAIPLAIGAAVIALGLIIEDIYQFIQGNDSVFGLIVQQIGPLFKNIADYISTKASELFDGFLTKVMSVKDAIVGIFSQIGGTFGKVGSFLGLGSKMSEATSLLNQSPKAESITTSASNVDNSQSSVVAAPNIVINAAPGTDTQAVANAAQGGTENALKAALRQGKRNYATGVAY